MNKKYGMSLVVLVITILVMIILAGAVVINITKNNSIAKANDAAYQATVATYKEELNTYIVNQLYKNKKYKKEVLNATGKDMKKYISAMKKEHFTRFEIEKGILIEIGETIPEDKLPKGSIPIYSIEQLEKIGSNESINVKNTKGESKGTHQFAKNANYVLMANLDFTGKDFKQIPDFSGNLNGNNKTLSNYRKDTSAVATSNPAIFAKTSDGSTIINLKLANCSVKGANYAAVLAGKCASSLKRIRVTNCSVEGRLNVGTIAGEVIGTNNIYLAGLTLSNDKASKVKGVNSVGGLIGNLNGAQLEVVTVNLDGKIEGEHYVGGAIGTQAFTVARDIQINITPEGNIKSKTYIGGYAGVVTSSEVSKTNIVVAGKIQANMFIGGLTGVAVSSHIKDINVDASAPKSLDTALVIAGAKKQGSIGGIIGEYVSDTGTKIPRIIENCIAKVNINLTDIITPANQSAGCVAGGIVGYVKDLDVIRNCEAFGKIEGSECIGGITGYMGHVNTIEKCKTHDMYLSGRRQVGGITGMAVGLKNMTQCFSDANIRGSEVPLYMADTPNSAFGGISGGIYGSCIVNEQNCKAEQWDKVIAKVENCYSIGSVDTTVPSSGTKIFNVGGYIGTVE
ncbi:MAG: type II secretion system protein, partial [Clostridia bacterium]